jgi:hypothetical protein
MSKIVVAALLASVCVASSALAQKYKADVPQSITTPDSVETRIGPLKFFDGVPDEATVEKAYDQLDFSRGIEAFLSGMPAASLHAFCEGFDKAGIKRNQSIGITEDILNARSLWLPPNSTTVYVFMCLDLRAGPMVVQVPPNVLGAATMRFSAMWPMLVLSDRMKARAANICSCLQATPAAFRQTAISFARISGRLARKVAARHQ